MALTSVMIKSAETVPKMMIMLAVDHGASLPKRVNLTVAVVGTFHHLTVVGDIVVVQE